MLLSICMVSGLLYGCGNSAAPASEVAGGQTAEASEETGKGTGAEESETDATAETSGSTVSGEETSVSGDAGNADNTSGSEVSFGNPDIIPLESELNYDYIQDENGSAIVLAHYPSYSISVNGWEKLNDSLKQLNSDLKKTAEENMSACEERALEDINEADGIRGDYYSYENTGAVTRADKSAVSILFSNYMWSGGAHPNSWFESATIDSNTGNDLTISDIVTDVDKLPEILEKELKEVYEKDTFLEDDLKGLIKQSYEANGDYVFTLSPDGITFYFSPYELAAYAMGAQYVTIPYDKYPDLIKAEYVKEKGDYILPVLADMKYTLANGDKVSITWYPSDEYGYEHELNVNINGTENSEKITALSLEPYLIRCGDKDYLYVQESQENDYRMLNIYSLQDGKLSEGKDFDRGFSG
ncbi:MAG: DUF3298 and DUF4163 domain-containing protein, partial [Lachnospiraceae bacterium]|nr:DUF3298 and DUF4163 domain-containing protein [Lachnospiraceae bacterium]